MPKSKYKYVEGSPTKRCSRCDEEKLLEHFPKNRKCLGGVTSTYRNCTNERQERWRRKAYEEREDFRGRRKLSQERQRAKKYGISLEELENLKERSNGVCEICGSKPSGNGGSSNSLHVDHCHDSGKVRGLLCGRCNIVIGQVEENPHLLVDMIAYMHKHKEGKSA